MRSTRWSVSSRPAVLLDRRTIPGAAASGAYFFAGTGFLNPPNTVVRLLLTVPKICKT